MALRAFSLAFGSALHLAVRCRVFVQAAALASTLLAAAVTPAQAKLLRVTPKPAEALVRAVAQLQAGDVLELAPGEYRASIDLRDAPALRGRSGVTIRAAQAGVTIKGSDAVGGWTQIGPGRYEKRDWRVEPQQVFVEGRALQQIGGQIFDGFPDRAGHELLALHRKEGGIWPGRRGRDERDLGPDSFYFDAPKQRLIVELARPVSADRLIAEVSVRTYLFFSEGVDGVRLVGMSFIHSNTTRESRAGAVTIQGHDAVVEDIRVLACDGTGLQIEGDRAVVARSRFEGCGQLGMKLRGADHRVIDNDLVGNNTRGFNKWWEAGGAKFVGDGGLRRGRVQGNRALSNHGDGLWFDWGNEHNLVERNLCAFNEGFGLHYEASGPARIAHNVSLGNLQRGLYALHSHELLIERNLVAFNGLEGIAVMDEGLRDKALDLEARGNRVRANIVAFHTRPALVLPEGGVGNEASDNLYVEAKAGESMFSRGWPSPVRPTPRGLAAWQSRTGQDIRSSAVTVLAPPALVEALRRKRLDDEWQALVVAAREASRRAGVDAQAIGPDLQLWR